MRSLVVAAVVVVGLVVAPVAGATEGTLDIAGPLVTARLATGGIEDSAIHYAGINAPQVSANQRQRLDASDPLHTVGVA